MIPGTIYRLLIEDKIMGYARLEGVTPRFEGEKRVDGWFNFIFLILGEPLLITNVILKQEHTEGIMFTIEGVSHRMIPLPGPGGIPLVDSDQDVNLVRDFDPSAQVVSMELFKAHRTAKKQGLL